ncbi:adenylyltransferase/cytidyltransferase family protein [Candidatus Kaiserbacteria bacterium]|nr:adenylyltransferase/cytidyltransferase family protein [Candidatus Kaiserbacteria bacterium]
MKNPKWVAVSGGFDPIHVGHVRLFKAARRLGDKLVVILNNDSWLRAKKGFVFMPQKERAELIRAFPFVDKVVLTDHKKDDPDRSVTRALSKVRPAVFANGGDRFKKNVPEVSACKRLGIKMVYNVGKGGKVQSSSWMIDAARKPASRTVRPWGEYYGWDSGRGWNLKTIYLHPRKRVSLQYHRHREEWWLLVSGDAYATVPDGLKDRTVPLKKGQVFTVAKKQVHRLGSKKGGVVVEVAYGDFDENDIVRLEDDHGRAPRRRKGKNR